MKLFEDKEELELNCDISSEYPAIFGIVFWCRTNALKKLFNKKWVYEDFLQEPLPDDGTISHAIERILAYVAQDAGYDTGTITTASYAAKQTGIVQEQMRLIYKFLLEQMSIGSVKMISLISERWDELEDFAKKNSYGF